MMSMGVLSALQQAAATARRDLGALQRRPETLARGDIMGASPHPEHEPGQGQAQGLELGLGLVER